MPPINNVLEPPVKVKPAAEAKSAYLEHLEKLAASGGHGVSLGEMSDDEIRKRLLGR